MTLPLHRQGASSGWSSVSSPWQKRHKLTSVCELAALLPPLLEKGLGSHAPAVSTIASGCFYNSTPWPCAQRRPRLVLASCSGSRREVVWFWQAWKHLRQSQGVAAHPRHPLPWHRRHPAPAQTVAHFSAGNQPAALYLRCALPCVHQPGKARQVPPTLRFVATEANRGGSGSAVVRARAWCARPHCSFLG